MTKKTQKGRKGRKGKSTGFKEPSASALTYNGPMRISRELQQTNLTTLEVNYSFGAITTTVAGALNNVFGSAPNGSTEWTSVSGNFDEYRVLAWSLKFVPVSKFCSTNGTVKPPVITVIDRDSSNNLTSYENAMHYESARMHSSETAWEITVHMSGVNDAKFINTASPVNTNWIKIWASGGTVSYTLGYLFLRYLVQFRGRV